MGGGRRESGFCGRWKNKGGGGSVEGGRVASVEGGETGGGGGGVLQDAGTVSY